MDDFYLTPMEKYAKRPDSFPAKMRVFYVSYDSNVIVTKNTKSYEPPMKFIPEVEKKDVIIEDDPDTNVVEFEQISLFDDEM